MPIRQALIERPYMSGHCGQCEWQHKVNSWPSLLILPLARALTCRLELHLDLHAFGPVYQASDKQYEVAVLAIGEVAAAKGVRAARLRIASQK